MTFGLHAEMKPLHYAQPLRAIFTCTNIKEEFIVFKSSVSGFWMPPDLVCECVENGACYNVVLPLAMPINNLFHNIFILISLTSNGILALLMPSAVFSGE